MTTNIFEQIEEFYPGMRCQFKEDWHGYYAGNIIIITGVIDNVYSGGVQKIEITFDDGYVMSSETAREVLAVQHISFIKRRLEANEEQLSELREALSAAESKPQQLRDIFGEFAKDIEPEESRVKSLNKEIRRLEENNEFLRKYEKAVFSFVGKYVKVMPADNRESFYIEIDGLFDMSVSLTCVKVNGMKIFNLDDFRHPEKNYHSNDTTVICVQKAFEAELNAVGIICKDEDEFGL